MSETPLTIMSIWNMLSDENELDSYYESTKEEVDAINKKVNNLKLACFISLMVEGVITGDELEIIRNKTFIRELYKHHDDPDVTISLALYHSSSIINTEYLHGIESDIIRRFQKGDLLNVTKEFGTKICPVVREGIAYDGNGEAIPTDKLFEFKGQCYNIDKLIEDGENGEKLDDKSLYDNILSRHIDLHGRNLNERGFDMTVFSDLTTSFDLSDNRLMYLKHVKFHPNVKSINLSNNPITTLKCKFSNSLESIDLSKTGIKTVNSKVLPSSLKILKLNYCHKLESLDLSGFTNLEVLEMDNCILIRELILPQSIKSLKSFQNSFKRIIMDGCNKIEEIAFTFSPEDQIFIVRNMTTIPIIYGSGSKSFTLETCILDETAISRIPNITQELTLSNITILKLDLTGFTNLETLGIINRCSIETLILPQNIKSINSTLNNYIINGCDRLDVLKLSDSSHEDQTFIIQNMSTMPKIIGSRCKKFMIANCSIESLDKTKIPDTTEELTLLNNPNLKLEKAANKQFGSLLSLKKFTIKKCPKITQITSGMFFDKIVGRDLNTKLHITCDSGITISPSSSFDVTRV